MVVVFICRDFSVICDWVKGFGLSWGDVLVMMDI